MWQLARTCKTSYETRNLKQTREGNASSNVTSLQKHCMEKCMYIQFMWTQNTFLYNVYFNIVDGHWTELGRKHISQRKRASSPIIFCDEERSLYTHVSGTYWYRVTVTSLQLYPFGSRFASGQLLSNTLSINQSRHSTVHARVNRIMRFPPVTNVTRIIYTDHSITNWALTRGMDIETDSILFYTYTDTAPHLQYRTENK